MLIMLCLHTLREYEFPQKNRRLDPCCLQCSAQCSVHPYSIHYNYGTPARDQLSIDSQFGGILPSTSYFSQNTRPPLLVHVPGKYFSSSPCSDVGSQQLQMLGAARMMSTLELL